MAKDFTNPWGQGGRRWPPKWMDDKNNSENLNDNLFRKVKITITNIEDGWGVVRSYPNNDGNIYKVPLYLCTVSGKNSNNEEITHTFKCIRFGVQYDTSKNIGPQVVGLKDEQSYTIKWVYQKNMGEYSWQVTGNWMIHRGASNPQTSAFGALGCIEITGSDEWSRFNKAILELTGASSENEVSSKKLATAYYERVPSRPPLVKYQ